jgi:hypothetical protein
MINNVFFNVIRKLNAKIRELSHGLKIRQWRKILFEGVSSMNVKVE